MAAKYSDSEILTMIQERKPLPTNYLSRIQLRSKRGHKERELVVSGIQGNLYRLILRQSHFNHLDFSIILAITPTDSNQLFRLRRYNGNSHEHTNQIEGETFYNFHVHTATQRYQELGAREDAYAEPTDRYSDLWSALDCMIEECGFEPPAGSEKPLFEGIEP